MITSQFIDELRRSLGNRTDISDERYVRWLNWALYDVCGMHRQRAFPARRFKQLEDTILFSLPVPSGTVQAATADTVTLPASIQQSGRNDYYVDTVIKTTAYDEVGAGSEAPEGLIGQERLVSSYNAATNVVTIAKDWEVVPDIYTTVTIYRRRYSVEDTSTFTLLEDIFAFQEIQIADTAEEIELVAWADLAHIDPFAYGSPTKIARRGDEFLLDSMPEAKLTLRAFVYKYPDAFDATLPNADSPIPDNWDEVIVLGAVHRGFEKLMEPDRSSEAYQAYITAATNRVEESGIMAQHIARGFKLRRD